VRAYCSDFFSAEQDFQGHDPYDFSVVGGGFMNGDKNTQNQQAAIASSSEEADPFQKNYQPLANTTI
jgi:hypothetical protein